MRCPSWHLAARGSLACVLVAGAALISGVRPARAAVCTYVVDDPVWQGYMTATGQALNAEFDAGKASVIGAMTVGFARMTSAIRVDASQSSLNAGQTSAAAVQSQQAYADAVAQQLVSEQILRAQADYGPAGQSVDACGSAFSLAAAARALDGIPTRAAALLAGVHAAPGSTMTGQAAFAARLEQHRTANCSPSEAAAGLCASAGARPSADVLAATLFDPAANAATVAGWVNNVASDPLTKPDAAAAARPEGVIRLAKAVRAEALRSPALVSLAAIRAQNVVDPAGGAGAVSPAQALDGILATYGGGPGYEAWHGELATKNTHGLLQELNKLSALRLKLRAVRSESNTRTAVIWAALLAAEADGAR